MERDLNFEIFSFDDSLNLGNMKFDHELGMVLPEGFELPTSSRNSRNTAGRRYFVIYCFLCRDYDYQLTKIFFR